MAVIFPVLPRLRDGFVIVRSWAPVRGDVPASAVSQPEIDPHTGFMLWIGKSGSPPLPIHAAPGASQGDIDRLAFNVCRRIDQALGLPVQK